MPNKMPAHLKNMVFDLGTTQQSFPLAQFFFGSFFLWLGLNIRIITADDIDSDTE